MDALPLVLDLLSGWMARRRFATEGAASLPNDSQSLDAAFLFFFLRHSSVALPVWENQVNLPSSQVPKRAGLR
jgi:hypothetical protein